MNGRDAELRPGSDTAEDDDAKRALLALSSVMSGETWIRDAGGEPTAVTKQRTGEVAGLLAKMQIPVLRRLALAEKRIVELESRTPGAVIALDGSPTDVELDAFEIALAAEGDLFGRRLVVDRAEGKTRSSPDRSLLAKIFVERAATAKRRAPAAAPLADDGPDELADVVHWAPTGNGHGLCGAALAFAEGEAGADWTGDALAVTCEACRDGLGGADGAIPIKLSPTSAGFAEASPVRAVAPDRAAPGIDMSRVFDAARSAIVERNWLPPRPTLPGDRDLFRLAQALGIEAIFAPAEPPIVVDVLHVEAARRICGGEPGARAGQLLFDLDTHLGHKPRPAHCEALAQHLEQIAKVVRARWDQ